MCSRCGLLVANVVIFRCNDINIMIYFSLFEEYCECQCSDVCQIYVAHLSAPSCTCKMGNITQLRYHIYLFTSKARVPVPWFYCFHLIFSLYDYNMLVEGLLSANLCLVTVLSSAQSSRLERFRLVHKTSSFKTKLIGNNAEMSRVNRNTL